mgnify:CR=1|tara:strand:- start:612 stop:869 length:258 start_codon:yes stop_codon:yes gene_type:complete
MNKKFCKGWFFGEVSGLVKKNPFDGPFKKTIEKEKRIAIVTNYKGSLIFFFWKKIRGARGRLPILSLPPALGKFQYIVNSTLVED